MKHLLVAIVSVTCFLSVVWCYSNAQCRSFDNALQDINYELDQESRKHNFYFHYTQNTYIAKTKHVLKELNTRIKQKQQSRDSTQCTALENAVKVKSLNYGLEIEGLEDSVSRFEKLIDFLDERNLNQRNDTDRKLVVSQQIALAYVDLQEDLKQANAAIDRLNQTNSDLTRNYQVLQQEYHRLLAKLHANAAAIHGKTGNITGLHNETATIKPELLNLPTANNVTTLTNSTEEAGALVKEPFDVDVRTNVTTNKNNSTNAEADEYE
ncbi:secreted protein [Culex quinquefasciatus]|uniref:Secreted protein n=1 Tax=Culex quinquefasciatus TaxID=7176 RepID=B0X0D8_CULQU|nr:secreted protein [Culex quinquefasciatus]|eukprot:XP_001863110.1 secreted protein [Culex quinquefasciatus]